MSPSILDTDTVSEYLRRNERVIDKVAQYLREFGRLNMGVITYYEILSGLRYKDARSQLSRFESFASKSNVISLTPEMAVEASAIQASLRSMGQEIGHTDTLIAGTAVVSGLTLITNNTRHFARVQDLQLANWIR